MCERTLTALDREELTNQRGLSLETIEKFGLFSVKRQSDLEALGYDQDLERLTSRIAIPYPGTDKSGREIVRIHKRSKAGTIYPPFVTPKREEAVLVVAESEIKAIAAYQLGYTAIGLQGVDSHSRRIEDLAQAIKSADCPEVVIMFDTDRREGRTSPSGSKESALSLAYGLEMAGVKASIAPEFPERYVQETEPGKWKADIDGALAAGMTAAEFREILDEAMAFEDIPLGPDIKANAVLSRRGLEVLENPEPLEGYLGQSIEESRAVLEAVARKTKTLCYDEESGEYDSIRLQAYAKRLKSVFGGRIPGLILPNVHDLMDQPARGSQRELDLFGLEIEPQGVYAVQKGKRGIRKKSLVANFVIDRVRWGRAFYLTGLEERVSVLEARQYGKKVSIEFIGNITNKKRMLEENSGLSIGREQDYLNYLDYCRNQQNIESYDAALDRQFVVGSYVDKKGSKALRVVDGIRFPQGYEECPYHDHEFPREGDPAVFRQVADLYGDQTVEVLLVGVLGTVLKPTLGEFYPHIILEGDSGTGKSTIRGQLVDRFDFKSYSKIQMESNYRTKKTFGNHNLPFIVEEANRLKKWAKESLQASLNEAYNYAESSHGQNGKVYRMGGIAVLLGQDFPLEDDHALSAKVVRLLLDPAAKAEGADRRIGNQTFPTWRWYKHVEQWVVGKDVLALLGEKETLLKQDLSGIDYPQQSNSSRTIKNYAALLVVADCLRDFGIEVNIQGAVARLLKRHLGAGDGVGVDGSAPMTPDQRLIDDVVRARSQPKDAGALVSKVSEGELYFDLKGALDYLIRQGHHYDVTSSSKMGELLKKNGARKERKEVDGVRKQLTVVPREYLEVLDIAFVDDGDGGALT